MVRALLDGRKTQTRRALKLGSMLEPMPHVWEATKINGVWHFASDNPDCGGRQKCPVRYEIGDRLWVREAWRFDPGGVIGNAAGGQEDYVEPETFYRADCKKPEAYRWKPAIHMPRSASRLTLTVIDVRVERLQDISEGDCLAEGPASIINLEGLGTLDGPMIPDESNPHVRMAPRTWYRGLWNSINGARAWDANSWVVALTFGVERRNIDAPVLS